MSQLLGALVLISSGVLLARWRTAWRASLLFLLLFILGQLAVLSLTDAPPYAVYQHLRLRGTVPISNAVPWAIFAAQLCALLVHRGTWWPTVAAILSSRAGVLHVMGLLAVVGFSAAVPAKDLLASGTEAASATALMLLAFGTLLAAFLAMPAATLAGIESWVDARLTLASASMVGSTTSLRPWDAMWRWWCAAWTLGVGLAIARFVFEGVPHIDDSVSYLFQAKVLASGHLTVPAPPDSAAFQMDEILIRNGRWFGYGFPGWPAVLSLGVRLNAAWLVNPIVSAATVLIAHALLMRLHGRGMANLVAALLCVSPWMLFMTGEFLGHPAASMWLMLALLAGAHCLEQQKNDVVWAAVLGAAGGMLYLTRPLDAGTGGLVVALWCLGVLGAKRISIRALVVAGAVSAAFVALGLAYNHATTGNPLTSPYRMWTDASWGPGRDRLGFGADIGNRAWPNIDPLPGHGLPDVILNLNKNLFQTNVDLFGWALGSLLLPLLYFSARWARREDRIWIALAVVLPVGYSAYWFSGGPDHGARYWYPLLVPLMFFSARSIERLHAVWRRPDGVPFVRPMMAWAVLSALLTFMPWRAATKYYRYREVGADLAQEVARRGVSRALVLIRAPERETYQAGFNYITPRLDGPGNVYARYLDEASRARLIAHFGDRSWWIAQRVVTDKARWEVRGPFSRPTAVP